MDVIECSQRIEDKIKLLETARKDLRKYAEAKALKMALYEKELAVCLIKLKNGTPFELDGAVIENPPATTASLIAKGIVWEAKQQAQLAEAQYKLAVTTLDSISAELNGYQSIFRHLEYTAGERK